MLSAMRAAVLASKSLQFRCWDAMEVATGGVFFKCFFVYRFLWSRHFPVTLFLGVSRFLWSRFFFLVLVVDCLVDMGVSLFVEPRSWFGWLICWNFSEEMDDDWE